MPPKIQEKFAKKITIPENQEKFILSNTIPESKFILNKNSKLTFCSIIKKGWKTPRQLNFDFIGKNAQLKFLAIITAEKNHQFKFETNANHQVASTKSDFQIRSILNDQAQVDYKGCLNIDAKAQETDANLAHHSLILSDQTKLQTIPCLEIEADNVKATHSATMGQIPPETFFYMKSRGISEQEAKKIFIKGFLDSELSKIPQLQ